MCEYERVCVCVSVCTRACVCVCEGYPHGMHMRTYVCILCVSLHVRISVFMYVMCVSMYVQK